MGRRGRDVVLQKTPPQEQQPTVGSNLIIWNLFLRRKVSNVPHQAPQPLGPELEKRAPRVSGYESQGGLLLREL